MPETNTPPTGPDSGSNTQGGLLADLIIALLTPLFLAAAAGNLAHARAAAAETLASYRTETRQDLLTVAKIIAFGLATIDSLSRSMQDDLTLNQVLRLRSNANATDRSEHRCRQALEQRRPQQQAEPPEPKIDTAALQAAAEAMRQQTAEQLAKFTDQPTPAPQPAPAATTDEDHQYAATWAASAAQIAAETAASLDSLPLEERQGAAMWVNVLNDLAKDFTQNGVPPRPKPGDLGSLFHGA